jgi:TPR repeat protein
LGSVSAYWILGIMYLYGNGCNADRQKAKDFFLAGTRVGNDLCWAGLGELFYRDAHFENWDKSWKKYFSSPFFLENKKFEEYEGIAPLMSTKEFQMCSYVNEAIWNKWEMRQQDLIYERKDEILAYIAWYRANSTTQEDAYQQVLDTIDKLVQQRKSTTSTPLLPSISEDDLKDKSPSEIFQLANQYYYVGDDSGSEQGISLYEKAALAGFKLAFWKVGRIYSSGYTVVQDREKAMMFLSKGLELGVDLCWTELADIFANDKIFDKWNYCWNRYFESKTFRNNTVFNELIEFDKFKSTREYQMFFYVQQTTGKEWETPFMPIVAKHRQEIVELIMQNPDVICLGDIPIIGIIEIMNMVNPEKSSTTKDYCKDILAKIPTS